MKLNQKEFGDLFDYSGQQISNFETGYREPPAKFLQLVEMKYGSDFGLTVGAQSIVPNNTRPIPYKQPNGKMLPEDKGGEMRPGSYGLPDLANHTVTTVHDLDNEMYLRMAREILTSGHAGTVMALKSNLMAFHEQVKDKAQLKAMGEKIDKLDKEIITLKTIAGGCAETSIDRETGNG